jgi:hypothetical protein
MRPMTVSVPNLDWFVQTEYPIFSPQSILSLLKVRYDAFVLTSNGTGNTGLHIRQHAFGSKRHDRMIRNLCHKAFSHVLQTIAHLSRNLPPDPSSSLQA